MTSFGFNRKEAVDNFKKRKREMENLKKVTSPLSSVEKTAPKTPSRCGVAQDFPSCTKTPSRERTVSFSEISPMMKDLVSKLDEHDRLEKELKGLFIAVLQETVDKVETFSLTNRKRKIVIGVTELLNEFIKMKDSDEEENEK